MGFLLQILHKYSIANSMSMMLFINVSLPQYERATPVSATIFSEKKPLKEMKNTFYISPERLVLFRR